MYPINSYRIQNILARAVGSMERESCYRMTVQPKVVEREKMVYPFQVTHKDESKGRSFAFKLSVEGEVTELEGVGREFERPSVERDPGAVVTQLVGDVMTEVYWQELHRANGVVLRPCTPPQPGDYIMLLHDREVLVSGLYKAGSSDLATHGALSLSSSSYEGLLSLDVQGDLDRAEVAAALSGIERVISRKRRTQLPGWMPHHG